MTAETLLLAQVLHNVPNGALWSISSDSWKKIAEIFDPVGLQSQDYEWVVAIDDSNRAVIKTLVEAYDLGETIIHMHIISKEGVEILKAYDHMCMIIIDKLFEERNGLSARFPELDIYT